VFVAETLVNRLEVFERKAGSPTDKKKVVVAIRMWLMEWYEEHAETISMVIDPQQRFDSASTLADHILEHMKESDHRKAQELEENGHLQDYSIKANEATFQLLQDLDVNRGICNYQKKYRALLWMGDIVGERRVREGEKDIFPNLHCGEGCR
jgi:hypothetical protein